MLSVRNCMLALVVVFFSWMAGERASERSRLHVYVKSLRFHQHSKPEFKCNRCINCVNVIQAQKKVLNEFNYFCWMEVKAYILHHMETLNKLNLIYVAPKFLTAYRRRHHRHHIQHQMTDWVRSLPKREKNWINFHLMIFVF